MSSNESFEHIKAFADRAGMSYPEVLDACRKYLESGDYFDAGCDLGPSNAAYDEVPEVFWQHMENLLAIPIEDKERLVIPFTCSC